MVTTCLQEHKATEVSEGYRPGEMRCPGELADLLPPSSRMAHPSLQLIKQSRKKTCLDEQGAPNLMQRMEGSIRIIEWLGNHKIISFQPSCHGHLPVDQAVQSTGELEGGRSSPRGIERYCSTNKPKPSWSHLVTQRA